MFYFVQIDHFGMGYSDETAGNQPCLNFLQSEPDNTSAFFSFGNGFLLLSINPQDIVAVLIAKNVVDIFEIFKIDENNRKLL